MFMDTETILQPNLPKGQEQQDIQNSTHALQVLPECQQAPVFADKVSVETQTPEGSSSVDLRHCGVCVDMSVYRCLDI